MEADNKNGACKTATADSQVQEVESETRQFEEAYRAFMKAGWKLSEVWDNDRVRNYPKYLPSFDDFMCEMGDMLGDDFIIGED